MGQLALERPALHPEAVRDARREPAAAPAPPRLATLDFIRAYAIILVVMVHASGPPLYAYNTVPRGQWWAANLYDSFARPCVPLFLMVSGFLLLDSSKDESLGTFFKKRLSKVLVPYLFWAAFYMTWRWGFHREHFNAGKVVRELFGGTAYYHLTFMNVILGMYLLVPLLRPFVRHASRSAQYYLLGLWFVAAALVPLFTKVTTVQVNCYLIVTPLFLGHFLFGAVYKRWPLRPRRWQALALAGVLVATVLLTAYCTHRWTRKGNGILDEYFYTYASPNVVVLSMLSFVLLMAVFAKTQLQSMPLLARLVRYIGTASYGIYFTHVVVLECLARGAFGVRLTPLTGHAALAIPLITVVVVLACAGLVWVLQKIPGVRYLLP